ncbi:hypothetical protein [Haloplanus halobius]|uniref:hypothetical protein n=1 Tax=Haloplanus halobius TaxID=2934938 RepID=UPI00200E8975|nr:hypothetical protein [Haloplanus sp. XH21]
MFEDAGRRRFLQLAGTGTALSLSGCSALSNHDGGATEPATATLAVQPDEESLQELQAEIRSQVESGELDRMQAQSAFRRRRIELTQEAVGRFQNRTGNTSVTVDDTISEFGVMRVTGSPAALLETLGYEEVSGIFPTSAFEEARSQAGGGTSGSATSTPTE